MQSFFCMCPVGVVCKRRSVCSRGAPYGLRTAAPLRDPMTKPLSMQPLCTAIAICYAKFRQN